jgi:hypothetical protein
VRRKVAAFSNVAPRLLARHRRRALEADIQSPTIKSLHVSEHLIRNQGFEVQSGGEEISGTSCGREQRTFDDASVVPPRSATSIRYVSFVIAQLSSRTRPKKYFA